jgi:hypothetical protein
VTRFSISVRSAPAKYAAIQPEAFGGRENFTDPDWISDSTRASATNCSP